MRFEYKTYACQDLVTCGPIYVFIYSDITKRAMHVPLEGLILCRF